MATNQSSQENYKLGSQGGGSLISLTGVVALIAIWWIVASLELVSSLILPSPMRVLYSAKDVGWDLLEHTLATTIRIIIGLFFGLLFGASIGFSMQFSRKVYLSLDGLIESIRPIPPVATVPFFILIFGFSEIGKFILVLLGTGLVTTIATIEAIERVDPALIRWGLVCGLKRKTLFKKIILPAVLPEMRGGVRIAHATAVTLVIVSEFMGSRYGLGYLINVSKITLTTSTIFLATLILGWVNWSLDKGIRMAFDHFCFWDIRAKDATL